MNRWQKFIKNINPFANSRSEKKQISSHSSFLKMNYPTSLLGDNLVINNETSLAVSYVYAAVNGISTDIASIGWPVLEKDNNVIRELRRHDQWSLLNERPYFAYNNIVWFKAWVANYLLTGDGFSEILRDENGRPRGYRLHHKKYVEVFVDYDTEDLYYKVYPSENSNKVRVVDKMDMLHLSDLSFDGLLGYSKMGLASKAIEIYKRSDTTQSEVQENATLLSGYIKIDRVLDEDDLKKIRESFKDTYGGSKGGVAVLDEGMEFTPFDYTMNLSDAEFIASRKFTGEEILRWFRYPAHMAGNLDRMTDNNIEQVSIEYVNYCLRPIVKLIESEFNYKLLRSKEKPKTYIKGQLKSLLRGDIESRMLFYETMWKIGAMTPNMALEQEDMNPVSGGNITYADLNKIPTDQVKEYYDSKIKLNNSKANEPFNYEEE